MLYFANRSDAFDPIPVDPFDVCGIHMRTDGSTVINRIRHADVVTSESFEAACYAIGSAILGTNEQKKSRTPD